MSRESFHSELHQLQQDLLRMGTLVEETIYKAVNSLKDRDVALAREVVAGDDVIDRMETDIEQRCLQLPRYPCDFFASNNGHQKGRHRECSVKDKVESDRGGQL